MVGMLPSKLLLERLDRGSDFVPWLFLKPVEAHSITEYDVNTEWGIVRKQISEIIINMPEVPSILLMPRFQEFNFGKHRDVIDAAARPSRGEVIDAAAALQYFDPQYFDPALRLRRHGLP